MSARIQTVAQALQTALKARENSLARGNHAWVEHWTERLAHIMNEAPSGAGINHGTTLDETRSDERRLVFSFGFHHMSEHGYYDGWTEHMLWVSPDWEGLALRITGRDRNQIKDYLHDVYSAWLSGPAPTWEPAGHRPGETTLTTENANG